MKRKYPRLFPIGILAVVAILAFSSFGVLAAGGSASLSTSQAGQTSPQLADFSGFQRAIEDLIIVVSGSFPGHVHFTGKVVSIDAGVWTVGARRVSTDARTHIIDAPVIGDLVLVNAATQKDGSLLAVVIKKITGEPIRFVHFSGKVVSINGSIWVIGEKTVNTDSNTKTSGSPVVGDTVKVTATLQADGSLLATSIDKVVKPVVFVGKVVSINGSTWTVGDKIVITDSNTKVSGSPVVGDTVWVMAILQPDNSYLASEIRKVTDNDQDFVQFSGKVVSINSNVWMVNDKQVMTDANTKISGSPVVGDLVLVVATAQSDGSFLAVSITKAGTNDDDRGENLDFTGKLTAINGSVWTVGRHMVTVDANTKVTGSPVVGDMIHVMASRQSDGTLLALTIDVVIRRCEPGNDEENSCRGTPPTPRPTPTVTATPVPTMIGIPILYPPPGSGSTPTPGPNTPGGGKHHRP